MLKTLTSNIATKFFTKHQNTTMLLIAGVLGLLTGIGAIGLKELINFFMHYFLNAAQDHLSAVISTLPWYQVLLAPALGGLLVGPLTYYLASEAKGHGVPEVMQAVSLKGGRIRSRVAFVKALATSICIGSGGSSGTEGPIVQIGSSLGSMLGQGFRLSTDRVKMLVGCGTSAGIAAAFNAPIAGTLFAMEIVLGEFTVTTFSPIVISSLVATIISRLYYGNSPFLAVPSYELKTPWEIPLYIALGIAAGVVAVLFIKLLERSEDFFDKLKAVPAPLRPMLGGLGVGGIALVLPQIMSGGFDTMQRVLAGEGTCHFLLLLVFAKIVATSLTLGSGGSGGIFAPSIFMGAVLGGGLGKIFHFLAPTIAATSGAYALVGMGALVAATTHGPVTAILIIFELTNDYRIILPIMVAAVIGAQTAKKLYRDSIYMSKLRKRGIDIYAIREINVMRSLRVRDIMHPTVDLIPPTTKIADLIPTAMTTKTHYFYLTDEHGRLVGALTDDDLKEVIFADNVKSKVTAFDLARRNPITLAPDDSLADAMLKFGYKNLEQIPVVDPRTSQPIGIVSRKDIILAYNREVLQHHDESLKFVYPEGKGMARDYLNLPEGHCIGVMTVPQWMDGRTIRNLNLRASFKINVLALKTGTSSNHELIHAKHTAIPEPDTVLHEGDLLFCLGLREDIDRFKRVTLTESGVE